jgi:hypothetical protein
MPQFLIAAVIVAGGWYAWKTVKREMARVSRDLDAVRGRPVETLEQDPKTGRYRVKRPD